MEYLKRTLSLSFALLMLLFSGCGGMGQVYSPAPSRLPDINRDMNRPGFWINRLPHPDDIIMGPEAVEGYNLHVEKELGFTRRITDLPPVYDGRELSRSLKKRVERQRLKRLMFSDGRPVDKGFYKEMALQMNIEGIPREIKIQYAVVITYADQRIFPSNQGLYTAPMNTEFDRLQNSALDLGTVVAVLHDDSSGRWSYVLSSLSGGWVESEKLAFCSRDQARAFEEPDSFVVATGCRADIYLDKGLTRYRDHVRMGTCLGMVEEGEDDVQVRIPDRDVNGNLRIIRGYMYEGDVSEGFLPYTPGNIIKQAFRCLNAPYGWGGMYGEQDCSRFINAVFSTVGVRLPRNSSAQAEAGMILGAFNSNADPVEKLQIIHERARAGATLLHLDGHIMLYIGEVDGMPYVIHTLWGYGGAGEKLRQIRVVNGTKVTSLMLGQGSIRGSLLDRLKTIVYVITP